ncbi:MAG: ATP synthase F1 subunit delta [Luteitalea sp.]
MTPHDARRAARALFAVCRAQGDARATLEGLQVFDDRLEGHAELKAALLSPFVAADAKHAITDQVSADLPLTSAARQTLLILADRHQLDGVHLLTTALQALVDRFDGRLDAEVTTAVPITDAQLTRLRAALADTTGQQVTLTVRVDPALVGGVVTRAGSVVYDGSLARQLVRMKERLATQV